MKKDHEFSRSHLNVFSMTLTFLVDIVSKVISRSSWNFYLCETWPMGETITSGKRSKSYSVFKNSWFLEARPSSCKLLMCCDKIGLFLLFPGKKCERIKKVNNNLNFGRKKTNLLCHQMTSAPYIVPYHVLLDLIICHIPAVSTKNEMKSETNSSQSGSLI